ncbi:hypothetical protein AGJ34_20680 [Cronobacter dublinensis subsp. dublinensis]|nr:hypothetical protein [Cronobacter dublinensis subsp. dublinensis]EGT5729727.1 hypothetical protein [Cronobacter dublinensis subsp. dublinensis]
MSVNISLEDAINQRDLLAKAIGEAVVKAGIAAPGFPLTGPQLLMLLDDLTTAFTEKPVLTLPDSWQDSEGLECVSADAIRQLLTDAGLPFKG